MKLKHTKGPWICNSKKEIVFNGDSETPPLIIADVWDFCKGEDEANARLIAAAPEMLDALIYFVKRVNYGTIRSKKTCSLYCELIEKATGMTIEEVLS